MDHNDVYQAFIAKFPNEFVNINDSQKKIERCKSILKHYIETRDTRRMTGEELSEVLTEESDWSDCSSTNAVERLAKSSYSNATKRVLISVLMEHLRRGDVINLHTIVEYIKILLFISGERHLLHVEHGGKAHGKKTLDDSHVRRLLKRLPNVPKEWHSTAKTAIGKKSKKIVPSAPIIPFDREVLESHYPEPTVNYRSTAGAHIGQAIELIMKHGSRSFTGKLSLTMVVVLHLVEASHVSYVTLFRK